MTHTLPAYAVQQTQDRISAAVIQAIRDTLSLSTEQQVQEALANWMPALQTPIRHMAQMEVDNAICAGITFDAPDTDVTSPAVGG